MDTIILNHDSETFLDTFGKRAKKVLNGKDWLALPIEEARDVFNQLIAPIPDKLKAINVKVEDKTVTYNNSTNIPVRIYKPTQATGSMPILVYFHGGGFAFGDVNFLDYSCRYIAENTPCIVVSVNYRRSPEHKFPSAHDDAFYVTKYIYEHLNEFGGNGKLAVGGDSAGGNLAASVCHRAKESNGMKIDFQLLFYPWVDLNNTTASDKKFGQGYFLELNTLNWMRDQYLAKPEDAKNPIANPQFQKDFKNLPPALVIIGEVDPIHDDAKMYYEKLIQAGVDAQYAEFGGILHDFCALPSHYEAATLAFDMACEELKKHLRK